MQELGFVQVTKRGDKSPLVRLAQEWLCLNGFSVVLDQDFGPGTELAVQQFQSKCGLPQTKQVDQPTWAALTAPMNYVLQPLPPGQMGLRQLVVAYAQRHLEKHPVEVGGDNRGPWVRLYMDGNEGPPWPWCAGFATFVLKQAADARGVPPALPRAFGCDFLGGLAQNKGIFLRPQGPADFARVQPGVLFLVRKNDFHWQHIGIVAEVHNDAIITIEGNTNDDGVPNGFEVCRRSRGMKDRDFLLV